MMITHNKLNETITDMEMIVSKGQIGSKNNRQRLIRTVLRRMREEQAEPIILKETLFYLWMWLKQKIGKRNDISNASEEDSVL